MKHLLTLLLTALLALSSQAQTRLHLDADDYWQSNFWTTGNANAALTGLGNASASVVDPAWISSLSWGKLTGRPTTLSGYGITDAATFTSTLTPARLLPRWRVGRSRVRTGTGTVRVLWLGDSTASGFGAAGAGAGYTGAKAAAAPARLASILTASGLPSSAASFMGANQTLVSASSYDPRITLTGWSVEGAFATTGKFGFKSTAAGSTFSFAPAISCDRVDIFWGDYVGNGGFTVNVDGGSTLATAAPSASGLGKFTVSFSAGVHTINAVTTSSGYTWLLGMVCYSSTSRAVDIVNAGFDAGKVGDLITSGLWFNPLNTSFSIAADVVIINVGINDTWQGTTPSSYASGLGTLIATLSPVSDIILLVPTPINGTYSNLAGITAAIQAYSGTYPIVDLGTRWSNYAAANAAGQMYDNLHPSQLGYDDVATAVAWLLLQ